MTTVKCKGNSMFTQYKLCILGSINLVIDKKCQLVSFKNNSC